MTCCDSNQEKDYQLTLVGETLKGIIIIIMIIIIIHIKARIDKTQQNSECSLCRDREEIINPIISECSKLVLKESKTRHNWVSKVIHWEKCKKFYFDHTNKWYMHNQAPVLENNTHKLLCDFEIHTDHRILTR